MNYTTITDRVNVITNNIAHDDTENAIYNIISFLLYPDNQDRESLSQYIDEIIEENKLLIDYYNQPGSWNKMFGPNFSAAKIIGTTDFKNIMLNLLQANIVLKRKSKGISEEYADITLGDIDMIKQQPTSATTSTTTTTTTSTAPPLTPANVNPIEYNPKSVLNSNQIYQDNLKLRLIVEEYNLERLKEEMRILKEIQANRIAQANQKGGHSYNKIKYIISNKKLFQLGGTWQQDMETNIKAKYADYTISDIAKVIENKQTEITNINNAIKLIDTQIAKPNVTENKKGGGLAESIFFEQLDTLLNNISNTKITLNETISAEQQREIIQIIMDLQAVATELNINMDNLLNELIAKYKDLFNIEETIKKNKTSGKLDVSSEKNTRAELSAKLADNIMDTIAKLSARARNPPHISTSIRIPMPAIALETALAPALAPAPALSLSPALAPSPASSQSVKIPLPMINTNVPKYKKYIVIKSSK